MNPLIVLSLTVALLSGTAMAAPANPLPTEQTAIGSIGDTVIRLEAIETRDIHELRVKLHEAIQQAFSARAISVLKSDKTGNYGINDKIEITDAQVKAFYQSNDLSKRGPIEEVGPQIKKYLVALVQANTNQKLYLTALQRGDIKTGLAEPLAKLVEVPVDTAYLYGQEEGKVMLLEFSDFQCPYCQRVQPTLSSLLEQYGDKVAFGYRHFPLDFHNDADSSAIATECAREQGKFMEMHDQLYKQQRNQSVAELKEIAKKIEVADLGRFNTCLDSEEYRSLVSKDILDGRNAGINGTPGFIIGRYNAEKGVLEGELLSGAVPEGKFKAALEKYLKSTATAR